VSKRTKIHRPDVEAFRDREPLRGYFPEPTEWLEMPAPVVVRDPDLAVRKHVLSKPSWNEMTDDERKIELAKTGVVEIPVQLRDELVRWIDELERIALSENYVLEDRLTLRKERIVDEHVKAHPGLGTPEEWQSSLTIARKIEPDSGGDSALRREIDRFRKNPKFGDYFGTRSMWRIAKLAAERIASRHDGPRRPEKMD
jgi:hypothetical protein